VAFLIAIIVITMAITFMCSLLEACLMSLSLTDIATISEKRPLIGSIWKNFRENIQKPIAVILIINTLATTVGSAFLGTQLSSLFGSHWVGVASVVFALIMIQWSEILPKTLGYRYNKLIAMTFGIPLKALVAAMTPFLAVSQFLSSPFIKKRRQTSIDTLGDINILTRFAALNKLISKEQARLVMKGIDLSKTRIANVMMPREQIKFLSSAMTLTDALIAAHHHYHTRYPLVSRGDLDSVIGYVNFKDIVIALNINPKDPTLRGIMRPMLTVNDAEIASTVLNKMIQAHHHIAIAQDQTGRVTGLVTLEDIIEEVIGDIQDEFDILPRFVRAMPDRRFLVGGATPMSELREKVCSAFPDEPTQLDTWIRSRLKKPPKPNDRVPLPDFDIVISKIRRSKVHEAIVSCVKSDGAPQV
jgi:CBS domain containing-hemolysin-like protein